ncbi:MAG: hypothetical protein HFP77_03360 [Methylococcales symbiont of Iophon sp. n. MRB-2018]|nr:MAG: hypothetical protein HFP77_03360 [Methylococcales symbiont of Iophon sp. n. MRB-2018]KAF3980309.1 MAG: hypothetical protein HFP76_02740 [Methylococcales symbiont of Iophon sp. n. MRB-2018]
MSKKDFEDLLMKHDEQSEEKKINWQSQKNEWLEFINQFYLSLENWLAPFEKKGTVSYSYNDLILTEKYIGTYNVRTMTVDFAGQQLTLEPIGTLLIGSKGRIDMEGVKGRVQFVLADKNSKGIKRSITISTDGEKEKKEQSYQKPEWVWKIVLKESRNISFVEFNEKNFFDALMEVVNG